MSNLKTEHEIEIDRIHDQQLAEKDAEIERLKKWNLMTDEQVVLDLKAEVQRLKDEYLKLDEKLEQALRENENQATLITELADLAEPYAGPQGPDNLVDIALGLSIQRAREAAR